MADHRQRSVRKGGNAEIRPDELMASWVYDEKFPTDMQFLFRTLPLTVGEDNDLEHPAQEQEKRRTSASSSLETSRTRRPYFNNQL
jgi:hypothetical protein